MNLPHFASTLRRTGSGAAWLLAGRVSVAVCGLVQVPLVFRQLGPAAFGVWVALTGLLWSLTVLDGGLGFAVQNRVTRLLATGDVDAAVAIARWTTRRLALVGAVALIVGLALARLAPWNEWLGAGGAVPTGQLQLAAAFVLVAASISLPLGFSGRLVVATQETWVQGASTTVAAVLTLAAFLVAARSNAGLPGFAAASSVLPVVAGAGTWWHVRRSAWWRNRSAAHPELRGLARESALFFAPVVGSAAIGAFVPTLTALTCGATAAGTFGVLQRLFGFTLQLHSQAMMPAWPAYAEAAAQNRPENARKMFRLTLWVTIAGFALPALAVTPFVPTIARWWLGADTPAIPAGLLWMMAGWHVAQYLGQMFAMVLNGVGRIGWMATLGVVMTACVVALGSLLGARWGAVGIVAALAAPYLLFNLPICAWQTRLALAAIKQTR